jgi:hypothetical protein
MPENDQTHELTEALGAPFPLSFAGKEWTIKPLTFNSLVLIEQKFGNVEDVDLSRIASQRFVLWVILNASDKSLTEEAVGDMLTLDKSAEVSGFIMEFFQRSGLVGKNQTEGKEAGETEKNAPARKAKAASKA